MALVAHREFYFILLVAFCVTFANSLNKNDKESKLKEIDKVFSNIEESVHSLKKVFQDILTEQLKDNDQENSITTEQTFSEDVGIRQKTIEKEECRCIPYPLCYPETGKQISDGSFLLESRANSYACDDPNEVCCTRYFPSKPKTKSASSSKCGYRYWNGTTEGVADSMLSNFGEFPWTVMINKAKRYSCAGSLIHPKVILTAAHCVDTTDDLTVRAGEWDTSTKSELFGHQDRNVIQIIKHPRFRLDNLVYDSALLITEKEFELQPNINTVCLTSASETLITPPDQCVATGWGIDKPNGLYNRIMKKIGFSLTDYELCQQALRSTRLGNKFKLNQSFFCANGQNGSDACQGNGGAPLICSFAKQPRRYQQLGFVSWGIDCAVGVPTVFTNMCQIKDWIDNEFDTLRYSKDYYTA